LFCTTFFLTLRWQFRIRVLLYHFKNALFFFSQNSHFHLIFQPSCLISKCYPQFLIKNIFLASFFLHHCNNIFNFECYSYLNFVPPIVELSNLSDFLSTLSGQSISKTSSLSGLNKHFRNDFYHSHKLHFWKISPWLKQKKSNSQWGQQSIITERNQFSRPIFGEQFCFCIDCPLF